MPIRKGSMKLSNQTGNSLSPRSQKRDLDPASGNSRPSAMASPPSASRSHGRVLGSNLNPKHYRSSSCEIPYSSRDAAAAASVRTHRGSSPNCSSHSVIINNDQLPQRPLGRYHFIHQQQLLQQQQHKCLTNRGSIAGLGLKPPSRSPSKSPTGSLDTSSSILANALRTTANIGLSVSQTTSRDSSTRTSADTSPNPTRPLLSSNASVANDLPYILRSVR